MSSSSQMLNPWESGVVPTAGAGSGSYGHFKPYGGGPSGSYSGVGGGGTTELGGSTSHVGHMGNPESKLALNLLNAVLSSVSTLNIRYSSFCFPYLVYVYLLHFLFFSFLPIPKMIAYVFALLLQWFQF